MNSNSSYYFLVFIVIGVFALSVIPSLKKSFAQASRVLVINTLKKVQADMFYISIEQGDFYRACSGSAASANIELILETGNAISCTVSDNYQNMAVSAQLKAGEFYCVDSNGFSGEVYQSAQGGHCSN